MGPPEAALYLSIILFCLMLQCSGVSDDVACPTECTCFRHESKNGMVANCSQDGAEAFPSGIPLDTVELHLAHYKHHVFTAQSLPTLPKLERLIINHCHLRSVEPNAMDLKTFPVLKVLDLRFNQLEAIPHGLSTNVKTLLLSNNHIEILNGTSLSMVSNLRELFIDNNRIEVVRNSSFLDMENQDEIMLPNLQKLVLNNNNISSLEDEALAVLPFLNAITFSNNKIQEVNSSKFVKLFHLQYLDLSNNELEAIASDTFFKLTSLKTLNLAHNRLQGVPKGLPMLELLDISHNSIKHITEDSKSDLYPAEVFNFAHNPLHCDCSMLWLKELYDQREYQIKHLDIAPENFIPSCASPTFLEGETWDNIGDSVFGCKPEKLDNKVIHDSFEGATPDLVVKSGKVTGDSIQVYWSWDVKGKLSITNVYVQYYVFGLRSDTTKHVEIAAVQREFTLKNLRPVTNYIICVIPKEKHTSTDNPKPVSLDHCLEVATKEGDPIEVLSFFYIVCFYILGMCATVIAIFSSIGVIALIYGLYSSKSDWASKNVMIDEPLDDSDVSYTSQKTEEEKTEQTFRDDEEKEHKD